MTSRLPRENDMPNGERVQAMIPGRVLYVVLSSGQEWSTESLPDGVAWIQIDVAGNGMRLLDYVDPNFGFPLRNGGVYTFGIPQADADAAPGVQPRHLVFRCGDSAALSIICAGA